MALAREVASLASLMPAPSAILFHTAVVVQE